MYSNHKTVVNAQAPKYVTFEDLRHAILKAKKAHPLCKKFAWGQVFKLSESYKKNEDQMLNKIKNQNVETIEEIDF